MIAYFLQGLGNDEIAEIMYLSINTIKTHLRNAYATMGVSSRAEAVLWAVDHGLAQHVRLGHEPVS